MKQQPTKRAGNDSLAAYLACCSQPIGGDHFTPDQIVFGFRRSRNKGDPLPTWCVCAADRSNLLLDNNNNSQQRAIREMQRTNQHTDQFTDTQTLTHLHTQNKHKLYTRVRTHTTRANSFLIYIKLPDQRVMLSRLLAYLFACLLSGNQFNII